MNKITLQENKVVKTESSFRVYIRPKFIWNTTAPTMKTHLSDRPSRGSSAHGSQLLRCEVRPCAGTKATLAPRGRCRPAAAWAQQGHCGGPAAGHVAPHGQLWPRPGTGLANPPGSALRPETLPCGRPSCLSSSSLGAGPAPGPWLSRHPPRYRRFPSCVSDAFNPFLAAAS